MVVTWMTKLDAGLTTSMPASDPGSTAIWGSKRINPLFVSDLEWMPFHMMMSTVLQNKFKYKSKK